MMSDFMRHDHLDLIFVEILKQRVAQKNTARLLKAFQQFHAANPEWKLMLIGKPGQGYKKIKPLLKQEGVHELGYVSDEEKTSWLGRATMLAHVSLEEGFCFPLLEAFAAGVPVLASDIPVLREVGGEACLFVTPTDEDSIVAGMAKLAQNRNLQTTLIARGAERVKEYTWKEVAEKAWRILIRNPLLTKFFEQDQ
jgi:alpha-1,3-rhamnosyl/mannosyltransferase